MRIKLSDHNRLNNDHLAWKFTYLGGHSPDSQRKDLCVRIKYLVFNAFESVFDFIVAHTVRNYKKLEQCRATADYLLVAGHKGGGYYGLSH